MTAAALGSYHEEVLNFNWPEDAGAASGLKFYGAAFEPETFVFIGELQVINWLYY